MHKLPSQPWDRGRKKSTGPVSCRRTEANALGRRRLSIGGAGTHGAVGPVGVQWSDGEAVKVLINICTVVSSWKVGFPLPYLGSTLAGTHETGVLPSHRDRTSAQLLPGT